MTKEVNEVSKNSLGGTELMLERLYSTFEPEFLNKFQIIPSRVRNIDETKHRIYWAHDLPTDPEARNALGDSNNDLWRRFHRIVFVSHWQRNEYLRVYPDIPFGKTVVLQNAIHPIQVDSTSKPSEGPIRFIYHTTPHRGLALLIPVFIEIAKKYGDRVHLDVYSSFGVYGWQEADKPYEDLFDQIRNHPRMTYHGAVSNDEVRSALAKSHVFVYPSIHPETSCLALIEAMSAGCICIHPDFAALPETAANWTVMYGWNEVNDMHMGKLYQILDAAVTQFDDNNTPNEDLVAHVMGGKLYSDMFYNWGKRAVQWQFLLNEVLNEPVEVPATTKMLSYSYSS